MPKKKESFESILERLEKIVDELNTGGLPLEDALTRFEEGIRLSREGARRIEEAERRIEEILENGTVAPLPEGGAGDAEPHSPPK